MFEPDDESKNYVIEKKEQQKLDDEFDKLDKAVDKYLTQQLNQLISPEEYKERNLEKISTQLKTEFFFKLISQNKKETYYNNISKNLQNFKDSFGYKFSGTNEQVLNMIHQCVAYKEAAYNSGPYIRINEPLLLIPSSDIQKNLPYEKFKYQNNRDPSLDELTAAC